jgi:membrane protein implicated in regulation of membrane protease activity
MEIAAWQVFIALGLLCLTLEIFSLSFYLAPIGVAALLTAAISLWISSAPAQIVFLCVMSFLLYLSLGRFAKEHLKRTTPLTGVGLDKQSGTLIKACESHKNPGKVKLYADTWDVLWDDSNPDYIAAIKKIPEGSRIKVIRTEGNRVVIEALNQ